MGGGNQAWDWWFEDDCVMATWYMTIDTVVQVDSRGTLPYPLPRIARPQRESPGERRPKGMSQERPSVAGRGRMTGFSWECLSRSPHVIATHLILHFHTLLSQSRLLPGLQ